MGSERVQRARIRAAVNRQREGVEGRREMEGFGLRSAAIVVLANPWFYVLRRESRGSFEDKEDTLE